ncbi:MAG: hypothetical protein SOX31_02285, partial [Eubacteriales bacterium]|nr:hypothetical protein [Eubacteriales bacterium]
AEDLSEQRDVVIQLSDGLPVPKLRKLHVLSPLFAVKIQSVVCRGGGGNMQKKAPAKKLWEISKKLLHFLKSVV